MTGLRKTFPRATKACGAEYQRHLPQKGESWRSMHPEDLFALLKEAWRKLAIIDTSLSQEGREQLIDIVNLGLMTLEQSIQAMPTPLELVSGEYFRYYGPRHKRLSPMGKEGATR